MLGCTLRAMLSYNKIESVELRLGSNALKSAYTIVELLVVTGIIVILSAILFPVFAASQPKNIAACQTNLSQLIAGANLYATNYDDHVLPWLASTSGVPAGPYQDVHRQWTSRLKPYVSSPIDPESGEPYFPPTAPYRCPDWNLGKLETAADAADCDGPGGIESTLPFTLGAHMRSELFSTYGLAFGMCSYEEAAANSAWCFSGGGGNPGPTDYGRSGTGPNNAMFAYAGDSLYPPSTKRYIGRTRSQIARPAETAMFGEGGIYKGGGAPGFWATVLGCEGDHMHWQHVWGDNLAFDDGHVAWIAGNPETYTMVGTDGFWIERYYTFNE